MRTRLGLLFLGWVVLIGTYPAQAQPILGTTWTNNQTILFWASTYATNYVLQFKTRLLSTNWILFTDVTPIAYGSQTAVTVLHPKHAAFFRLMQIPTAPSDGMVFVPASSFTIGDTLDGESDAISTNVYVSSFYISTNLVSFAQWQTIFNYAISQGYDFDLDDGISNATNQPVQSVNWYDVVKWSNARSQQAGLTPVYYTDAQMTQVYSNGDVDAVFADFTANGYRLPTEAEWEKAARGGLSGQRFPWGNTISESQANYHSDPGDFSYDLGPSGYNGNYDSGAFPYTSPVGAFPANGYGLNDMAGNVFEWCWDWYAGVPYPTNSAYLGGSNPTGPASSPVGGRVLRGGSWGGFASFARCANRGFGPEITPDAIGFRCVKSP